MPFLVTVVWQKRATRKPKRKHLASPPTRPGIMPSPFIAGRRIHSSRNCGVPSGSLWQALVARRKRLVQSVRTDGAGVARKRRGEMGEVGAAELESATSTMSTWRSNHLSYAPKSTIRPLEDSRLCFKIDLPLDISKRSFAAVRCSQQ